MTIAGDVVRLENVFFHVTRACNRSCGYCYFSARKPMADELRAHEIAELWPDVVALRPAKLVVTGGEPLLRGDLVDLLRSLRAADPEHSVLRCVNTNGDLVTTELARSLVGLADEVRVSLDALPARNDALRGEGAFASAVQALETLHGEGFEPIALVTLTAQSVPDLEELVGLLLSRQITRIHLNGLRALGRGVGHPEWVPASSDVREAVRRALARSSAGPGRPAPPIGDAGRTHCGVGRFLNILPNGDVYPCHALVEPAFRCGNVREQRLVEICRASGLLGELQMLDFPALTEHEATAGQRTGTCLATLREHSRSSAAWCEQLPSLASPES